MRTARLLTLTAAATIVACSSGSSRDSALSSDLQRDLQLATSTVALPDAPRTVNFALETAPASAPERTPTLRRGAGTRVVRTPEPTVTGEPDAIVAESVEQTQSVSEVAVQETPSETPAPSEGVALPRPTAIPVSLPADEGSSSVGRRDGGGGRGGGIGTIIGVVIRGGGVGEDHCEIHDRRGRGRPVYRPSPGGIAGGRRPMIGPGTFPVNY